MNSFFIFGRLPVPRAVCTLSIFAWLSGTSWSRAEDWPHWRGPDLNGISKEKGWTTDWPKEGPRALWKASVGTGFSSVSVANGRVLTLGNKANVDTVYCLDAGTGQEQWKFSYDCPLDPKYYEGGPGSTPTVEGDRVYTLSKRGHLFCFETATGRVIWRRNLIEELGVGKPEWGFAGSPLVEGDLLVLNVGGVGTAVHKSTGKIVWTSGTNTAGYATPMPYSAGGERRALIFSGKSLAGIRVSDGRALWRLPWETRWDINAADPIQKDHRWFVSTFDRGCGLLDLSAEEPSWVWTNKNMANHFNSCVLLDGYVYGIHGNTDQKEKDLRCLDWATGRLLWTYEGLGLGSLMAADGKLIVLSERGELLVAEASPRAFQPLARAQVIGGRCWTVPVLANGRIYCRNAEGTLVCVDVRAGKGS